MRILLVLSAVLALTAPAPAPASDDDVRTALAIQSIAHIPQSTQPYIPQVSYQPATLPVVVIPHQTAPVVAYAPPVVRASQPLPFVPVRSGAIVGDSRGGNWHSHTCAAGHTWSHRDGDPNASHNCPVCGRYQNVISQRGPAVQARPRQVITFPALGGSDCSSGQCYRR